MTCTEQYYLDLFFFRLFGSYLNMIICTDVSGSHSPKIVQNIESILCFYASFLFCRIKSWHQVQIHSGLDFVCHLFKFSTSFRKHIN